MANFITLRMFRNNYGLKDIPSKKNHVNLEYSNLKNIGDSLSPVIVDWMLKKQGINIDKPTKKTKHLMAVGSIVSRGRFNATIWGSGILKDGAKHRLDTQAIYKKYDIRAVRGPETRAALMHAGYKCPKVFGDPAILMPLIYSPSVSKKHDVSLILHHRTKVADQTDEESYAMAVHENLNIIDPSTTDYKSFINELVASKYIISSSLHGIILAECYGIPASFLNFGVSDQVIKFNDWYRSTGRELTYCSSIKEALSADVPDVPDLKKMQQGIMDVFPYDLWND